MRAVSLLLFGVVAVAYAENCPIVGHVGTDRPYGDLPGMPFKSASVPDCGKACEARTDCVAWAYAIKEKMCWLKQTLMKPKLNSDRVSGVKNTSIISPTFSRLRVGTVHPRGWLKSQMELQELGLTGQLADFWSFVKDSSWIGGRPDPPHGVSMDEVVPYWMNGMIPLSFQLHSNNLVKQRNKYMDYILSHQTKDGWLGPDDHSDYWTRFDMLHVFIQYHQGNQSDPRILPALYKFLPQLYQRLMKVPLYTWGAARFQEAMMCVEWLLEHYPCRDRQVLWDLLEVLNDQGLDWKGWYGNKSPPGPFPTGPVTHGWNMYTHGVNNGQAIKAGAIVYRFTHNKTDLQASFDAVDMLTKYHGQATGMFTCDEHLAGRMPSHGTETCTVVETLFSFETVHEMVPENIAFADRAERIAYNALPAALLPNMTANVYLQANTEYAAMYDDPHVWITDGPPAGQYGIHRCCTANFNQGWPKYLQSLFHTFVKSGLTHVAISMYGPAEATIPLNNGHSVQLEVDTDYPFDDVITITATAKSGFPLVLRIPQWANVTVNIAGKSSLAHAGTWKTLNVDAGKTIITLTMHNFISVERRYNNALSVYRGPLLFALDIGQVKHTVHHYYNDIYQWNILNTTAWNYALQFSEVNTSFTYVRQNKPISAVPFQVEDTPVFLKAKGRLVPQWKEDKNAPAPAPESPVVSGGKLFDVVLHPYGSTNIRMSELPTLKD